MNNEAVKYYLDSLADKMHHRFRDFITEAYYQGRIDAEHDIYDKADAILKTKEEEKEE